MQILPPDVCLEDVHCPNGCHLDSSVVLVGNDRLHQMPGEFQIVRCDECGLERTNPRPTPETIGIYYPSDYMPYQSSITTAQNQSKVKAWFRRILGLSARQLPPVTPGRMLEVGCASGSYMEQMRNIGWRVDGIEFSESASSAARAKGFKVQASSLEDATPPTELYDVITAWMVLEHLHEPVKALTRMRGWVKPNGYLVALVPDSNSLAKSI